MEVISDGGGFNSEFKCSNSNVQIQICRVAMFGNDKAGMSTRAMLVVMSIQGV